MESSTFQSQPHLKAEALFEIYQISQKHGGVFDSHRSISDQAARLRKFSQELHQSPLIRAQLVQFLEKEGLITAPNHFCKSPFCTLSSCDQNLEGLSEFRILAAKMQARELRGEDSLVRSIPTKNSN